MKDNTFIVSVEPKSRKIPLPNSYFYVIYQNLCFSQTQGRFLNKQIRQALV